ncbi:hypothetical protein [Streptomyces sp. TLI_146]|uniref:hypothetical protein n=1 Tax=Streptomyces sp. TLI_146 TaxID=1938858 RepID=UPI000C7156DD|nr:hypothetical protein [Streptomyces sp. TLI_146]PKV85599.1 hypothetical protein BX283_3140 [Streptomyces sp. TLI_146]
MILSLRATAAAAVLAVCALAVSGCGAPTGLGDGGAAPPVAAQPSPRPLWPNWSEGARERPGAGNPAGKRPPPAPLAHGPEVPEAGLAAVDPYEVLRADPRTKPFGGRERIHRPGQPGIRPPVLHDLTGDGSPELVLAADLESGRTVLAVYTARAGKVVPVLYTVGKRLAVETVGTDLVVRSASDDGAEQAVRYRWDGARLESVSDIRTYKRDESETVAPEDGP